ncbi:MAG TPA: tetratricopeptide repeat protein [Candidatus Dormibacteraeota bacterium]|nr:tetratricopeptide repeat protein [Candidatus Dormibacteraeota bacterium]
MLPQRLTTFVGRDQELDQLAQLLDEARLLTLTGAGGCGKTRLALEAGSLRSQARPTQAHFVDLAPVAHGWLVPHALAAALGVSEKPQAQLLETVCAALQSEPALIVIDNCEHLLQAAAEAADALLRGCPQVRIIATSREALNIAGETCFQVAPLEIRDAVRLFLQRARLSRPRMHAEFGEVAVIQELCERLDRLPLAVELAAGRLRALPLGAVGGAGNRFELLSSGPRTAPPRQQSLRASLDWSYDLLDEDERNCFHRLAVFAGGCDGRAAAIVCESHLDTLVRLAEKSMVMVVESTTGPARYRLLETVREYAAEKLASAGQLEATRHRHLNFFLELAETAAQSIRDQARSAQALELDQDNLRAALDWAGIEHPRLEMRLAAALGWFWFVRGHLSEATQRLTTALSRGGDRDSVRASALKWAGSLARDYTGIEAAQSLLQDSLAISREVGDEAGEADTLHRLAGALRDIGAFDSAADLYAESLSIYERLNDSFGIAVLHFHHGLLAHFRGDTSNARRWLEQSETELRAAGNEFHLAQALNILGLVALELGDLQAAQSRLEEALSICSRLQTNFGAAIALDGLSALASLKRSHERALRLAGAAEAVRSAVGMKMSPNYHKPLDRWRAPSRKSLGAAAAVVYEEGRRLGLQHAIAYGLGERRQPQFLSRRELQIAEFVTRGLTSREIAQRLGISTRTAEGHVERLRNKLGFRSRAQVAAWMTAQLDESSISTLGDGSLGA